MADVGALYWSCILGWQQKQERNEHENICREEKDGMIFKVRVC